MNTLEAIAQRYSERNFRAQQIDEKDLELLLKAGMQAPVASGHYDSLHMGQALKWVFLLPLF